MLSYSMPNQYYLIAIKKILSRFRSDILGKRALNDPHVQ